MRDLAPPIAAPERDTEGALARLVDVLLDKGVYLDLDLLVSVAGVPLIAVNLRATIAGVETMLAYGIPGVWTAAEEERAGPRPERRAVPAPDVQEVPVRLREPRATGAVWRPGTLVADGSGAVRWFGDGEPRPDLLLEPGDVRGVEPRGGADRPVLAVRTDAGERLLAPERAEDAGAVRTMLQGGGGAR